MKFKLLLISLFLMASCSIKKYQKIKNYFTDINVKQIKNDSQVLDSVYHYIGILEKDRLKYRLENYLNNEYSRKQFLHSLLLESRFGANIEFSNNMPIDSPKFTNIDSLENYLKESYDKFIQEIKNRSKDTLSKNEVDRLVDSLGLNIE